MLALCRRAQDPNDMFARFFKDGNHSMCDGSLGILASLHAESSSGGGIAELQVS